MQYMMLITCDSPETARHDAPRIEGSVALDQDRVVTNGYIIEVYTDHPDNFVHNYVEEGFEHNVVMAKT